MVTIQFVSFWLWSHIVLRWDTDVFEYHATFVKMAWFSETIMSYDITTRRD